MFAHPPQFRKPKTTVYSCLEVCNSLGRSCELHIVYMTRSQKNNVTFRVFHDKNTSIGSAICKLHIVDEMIGISTVKTQSGIHVPVHRFLETNAFVLHIICCGIS